MPQNYEETKGCPQINQFFKQHTCLQREIFKNYCNYFKQTPKINNRSNSQLNDKSHKGSQISQDFSQSSAHPCLSKSTAAQWAKDDKCSGAGATKYDLVIPGPADHIVCLCKGLDIWDQINLKTYTRMSSGTSVPSLSLRNQVYLSNCQEIPHFLPADRKSGVVLKGHEP